MRYKFPVLLWDKYLEQALQEYASERDFKIITEVLLRDYTVSSITVEVFQDLGYDVVGSKIPEEIVIQAIKQYQKDTFWYSMFNCNQTRDRGE